VVEHALLGGDRGHDLRHADAEVDDAAERQLEGAAARDQLALVQRRGAMRSTGTRSSAEKAAL
jgi:hypothetical protein